jgi:uncharacterized protein (TIGR03118 family)
MAIALRATTPEITAFDLVKITHQARTIFRSATTVFFLLSMFMLCAAARVSAQHYQTTNLVSDVPGLAARTDPDLVNPWGLIATGTSPWWVADNGTGLSTLYNAAGVKQGLIVTIAKPPGDPDPATPTGVVNNPNTGDFKLTAAATSAARFIFVTEDGTISGWAPSVNATNSIIKVSHPGTFYKGVTIAQAGGVNYLYVANFSGGTVDVYDTTYTQVTTLPDGAFTDPKLPEGFAPFNVQNIGGDIYVAFAKQDDDKHDEVAGRKLGYVDVFDGSGTLLQRFENGPWMNAPWGLALAPSGNAFGKSSGKLLVGMFGSGQVATFDPVSGDFEGLLRDRHGKPIEIDGLWALRFGNGGTAGPTTTLFFTAGIDDEQHGLFGTITPIPKKNDHDDGDDQ